LVLEWVKDWDKLDVTWVGDWVGYWVGDWAGPLDSWVAKLVALMADQLVFDSVDSRAVD